MSTAQTTAAAPALIFPTRIVSQLVALGGNARMLAQSAPGGRGSAEYRAAIRQIDLVREDARARRPAAFRYGPESPDDPAPRPQPGVEGNQ